MELGPFRHSLNPTLAMSLNSVLCSLPGSLMHSSTLGHASFMSADIKACRKINGMPTDTFCSLGSYTLVQATQRGWEITWMFIQCVRTL
jgi:hypothetical protein